MADPKHRGLGVVHGELYGPEAESALGELRHHPCQIEVLGLSGPQWHEGGRHAIESDAPLGHLGFELAECGSQTFVHLVEINIRAPRFKLWAVEQDNVEARQ